MKEKLLITSLVLALTACGGGGGGDTTTVPNPTPAPTPAVAPPSLVSAPPSTVPNNPGVITPPPANSVATPATSLIISEFSTDTSSYVSQNWVEIHNPTNALVKLDGVVLRSTYIDTNLAHGSAVAEFAIPANTTIQPNGYLVLAADDTGFKASATVIPLSKNGLLPYWSEDGFIELALNGKTMDAVVIGNSKELPLSPDAWTGASITIPMSQITNASLARKNLKNSSKSKADWFVQQFATAGGINDAFQSSADTDKDGIPDYAELPNTTYNGIDYYALGARINRPDIFIQVDSTETIYPAARPQKAALQKVVDAFALKGIAVHFDAGTAFSPVFSHADFNLGQGKHWPVAECIRLGKQLGLQGECTKELQDYKTVSLPVQRNSVFHYMIFTDRQSPISGTPSLLAPAGIGEINGNDFLIYLGDSTLSLSSTEETIKLNNTQAAVVMHELGHNLGLQHGGDSKINYRPNYLSVMNYSYRFVPKTLLELTQSYKQMFDLGRQANDCPSSPTLACNASTLPNYSDGTALPLDENNLSELTIGLGGLLAGNVDWNYSNNFTNGVAYDVNFDGIKQILTDYNDWANLKLDFYRNAPGLISVNSGSSINASNRKQIKAVSVGNDHQEIVYEDQKNDFKKH